MSKAAEPETVRQRTALKLADAAWRQFDRRRAYEWKIAFALWTALGVLAGFFWKDNPQIGLLPTVGIVAVLLLIAYMYWFKWSIGLWLANRYNQDEANHYWARADGDSRYEDPFRRSDRRPDPEARRSWKQTWETGRCVYRSWSHGSQIGITLILIAIVAVGALRSAKW
jgi:hypothetical protein